MLLKTLQLENIRSYNELNISFYEGSTLLSGDIGSGKTTILLAVEFALFGVLRGSLNASSLLRRGTNKGTVTLTLDIDGKEVEIQRVLKRSKGTINQSSGYIKIDDVKTESTPIELKSKVLELIGYPEEFLTKSKSLIYRYTVYTPQEDMKQIIYEHSDARLEKLRKIFDVDKYKTVKQNAQNYAKELRGELRELKAKVEDAGEIQDKLLELKEEVKKKNKEHKEIEIRLTKKKEEEQNAKELVDKKEEERRQVEQLKKELEVNKNKKQTLEKSQNDLIEEQKNIEKSIVEEEKYEKSNVDLEGKKQLEDKIKNYKAKIEEQEENLKKARSKEAVIKDKENESNSLIKNIDSLEECPKCLQKVTKEHKEKVEAEEKKKLEEQRKKKEKLQLFIEKAEKQKLNFEESLEKSREELSKYNVLEEKLKAYNDSRKRKQRYEDRKQSINKKHKEQEEEIKKINQKINDLEERIKKTSFEEKAYEEAKKAYEEKRKERHEEEVKIAEKKQEIKNLKEKVEEVEKEIERKKKLKELINEKKETENWMSNHFVNLVDSIEKHVFSSIHREFNENFKAWFDTLLEDESINSELDETFTPRINQNGYDADILDLSGGEKTATALAYRLALNKVINDYVGSVKTRDILILDEPTDGFSNDQLDKLRDVLEQLNVRQVIIVSHEQKLESMVETIIRVQKREHVSEIVE